jgi:N-acetylmuramoyl-L-alanine amidase
MRFAGAAWHGPVPNRYPGGMITPPMGLVLHIMQSLPNTGPGEVDTIEGCDSWFHNPASGVSAHFGTGTKGELYQWVDTDDAAWAIVLGNDKWISIENAGLTGEVLLPSQLASCAAVFAWLHQTYGVPLESTNFASAPGLGWHGMGGAAWGDHLECPGQPILDQRPEIISAATELLLPAHTTSGAGPHPGSALTPPPSEVAVALDPAFIAKGSSAWRVLAADLEGARTLSAGVEGPAMQAKGYQILDLPAADVDAIPEWPAVPAPA